MAVRWNDWAHVMWSTRGQWLPGDPRGFRDHDHRVHSSGDYRRPPPRGEHAELLARSRALLAARVVLSEDQRRRAGLVLVASFERQRVAVRAIAVAATHVHALIRVGQTDARAAVGVAKQRASCALHEIDVARKWGQRCHIVRVRDQSHYRAIVGYVLQHAAQGAWAWQPDRFAR
jgi:REP element-mobilizing transposase RayT